VTNVTPVGSLIQANELCARSEETGNRVRCIGCAREIPASIVTVQSYGSGTGHGQLEIAELEVNVLEMCGEPQQFE